MQKWYNELAIGQQWVVYIVSLLLPFVVLGVIDDGSTINGGEFGILCASLIPLLILIFLHLGPRK